MELEEDGKHGSVPHVNGCHLPLIISLATTLYNQIIEAKRLYLQKRDHFRGLSELFATKVPKWNKLDRNSRVTSRNKEVQCVYRFNQKKGNHLQPVEFIIGLMVIQFPPKWRCINFCSVVKLLAPLRRLRLVPVQRQQLPFSMRL